MLTAFAENPMLKHQFRVIALGRHASSVN